MKIRIEDAIHLQKSRQHAKNGLKEIPLHTGVITKANLGRLLFPSHAGRAPLVRMSNIIKGVPTFRPEWIVIVCKECGVDANFLFGQKSVHDKEFKKL